MNLTSTLFMGLCFLCPLFSIGQNLFQNPDFEQYQNCPNAYNQLGQLQHWQSGNQATPDYFNCGFSGSFVQGTASQGSGVIGLWGGPNHPNCPGSGYAENIQSPLTQAILPGKQYLLSFDIQLDVGTSNDCMMFGFYFFNSQSSLNLTGDCAPNLSPQISVAGSAIGVGNYTHFDFYFSPDQTFDQVLISPFTTSATNTPSCSSYSNNRMYLNLDNLSLTEQVVLPLQIEHFSASKQHSDILLEWVIHHTGELDFLEIERSVGLSQPEEMFEPIAFLPAQSCDETAYAYLDQQAGGSVQSYRIKAVDQEGMIYYSSIATVDPWKGKSPFIIYPNPSKGLVQLQRRLDNQERISWSLWGNHGQQLFSHSATFKRGLLNIPLDLQSFPRGVYALVVKNGCGEEFVERIILY
ncbi:MAG: hypothetical protein AAF587_34175 [Bacteroidota bacterium]